MVDIERLKDIWEVMGYISAQALVFGEAVGYIAKLVLYPNVKNGLEKKVVEGEMDGEEADCRLQTYRICMFLPWPIDRIHSIFKMKRYNI